MIFKQINQTQHTFIREFSPDVEESELVWHRDKMNRKITILSGTNWKVQFDNQLPTNLVVGQVLIIGKEVFHRLWRGNDTLTVRIEEF